MTENELKQNDDEDKTQVFVEEVVEDDPRGLKGLQNFSHLMDDWDETRVSNPTSKMNIAYINKQPALEAAKKAKEEEAAVRQEIEAEIKGMEAVLQAKIKEEHEALTDYRSKTNTVMCLEMEEPCRWNNTYQQLKQYVIKTGDLPPVPSACTTELDRRLSIWIQEQKSLVYSKATRIVNAPHRIEALEALGIEWIESSDDKWNRMYKNLKAYKQEHNTVILPSFMQCRQSKNKELTALRHWIDLQEQEVKSWSSEDISKRHDKLKKLQELGLPIKLSWEQEWNYYILQLLKFRSKYGHLNSQSNDPDLNNFLTVVLSRLKRGSEVKLTQDEMNDLRLKGLLNDLKDLINNPTGRSATTALPNDINQIVSVDRIKEVNLWAGMLEQLKKYQEEYNSLEFPGNRAGYQHLKDWVDVQRKSYEDKTLEEYRIKELSKIGLEFDPWNDMLKKLKKFKREGGTARLPKEFKSIEQGTEEDIELNQLCKWQQDQIKFYRRDDLSDDKKKKLRKLGVVLTKGNMGKVPWEDRFEEMMNYYHKNKTCLPKRDGPLRQWVVELVDLLQNGFVSNKRQQLIDSVNIGYYLKPEVIYKEDGSKKRKGGEMAGQNKKLKAEEMMEV